MSSTVVLLSFAILHNVSPFLTMYVVLVVCGIFIIWPTESAFDVKLFSFFISSTVVLNSFAILNKVSPFFIV